MKKITNLLIIASLALAGAVMAQQPTPEESQSPGKKPTHEKKAPAEVKPAQTRAPKTEAPAVAPKTEAPAVKEPTANESPAVTKPEKKAPSTRKNAPAATPKTEAPAMKESTATESPAVTKPEKKAPSTRKNAPATTPETKTSAEQPATSATPADMKTQSRKDKKSPAANAKTSPSASSAAAKTTATPAAATASPTPATATASTTPATTTASTTPATAASTTPATAASASAAPSVSQTNATSPANPTAATKKPDPQKIQQIRQQHQSFRAQARPDRVPPVSFSANFRLPGSERWQGPQYEVYRSYHPERHDQGWYRSHYQRVELIAGGYYYFNSGYWYPAWGYDPGNQYYAYDAPIYVGKRSDPPDKVIADVQAALQEMGYYKGEVDGLIGPLTREALTAYQTDNGMTVTAVIDEPTLASLDLG